MYNRVLSKARFWLITSILVLSVSGCLIQPGRQNSFPSIDETYVSPLSNFGAGNLSEYVLFKNGDSLLNYNGDQINLQTGNQISSLFQGPIGNFMLISPNDRYISGSVSVPVNSNDSNSIKSSYLLYDLQTRNTFNGTPGESVLIGWSSDSSRFLLGDFKTLVSVSTMKPINNWMDNSDFRVAQKVSGYNVLLWDDVRNIPIATLRGCSLYCLRERDEIESEKVDWGLIPISDVDKTDDYSFSETIFSVELPNAVVDWTFDPSGRYVLLILWEQSVMPTKDSLSLSENVTDSVLFLVNWQTKQSIELLRLSTVDNEHVVAKPASARWSTDGTTILVPREGSGALILKLKYP